MEFYRIFKRISFPNRDIEERVASSGIIDSSPSRQNGHQGQESRNGRYPSLHAYPCKTPSPTMRLARQESDVAPLQPYKNTKVNYKG
ncbi:hypothetical protein AVEN_106296-1 [Araneus ventricosus]|uniref:Uncharacterized protein n=1 Tax=Araneus ventricosus TaxID=182803 RepID=A0A4Y2AU15_ARAVE|nr:hypothetical protein AVEN_106296-1 [Araneus ventricosus]